MGKKVCIFGQLFREVRRNSGLSQWNVSVKAGIHLSSVHQIEAGHQEPRILGAMRLVGACGGDLSSFFSELAGRMNLYPHPEQTNSFMEGLEEGNASYSSEFFEITGYGDLLRYCRTQKGLSQKTTANNIDYDLRSLQRVEKGEQEPKVTTAVKLVTAIEMPPGQFFEWLGFFLSPIG